MQKHYITAWANSLHTLPPKKVNLTCAIISPFGLNTSLFPCSWEMDAGCDFTHHSFINPLQIFPRVDIKLWTIILGYLKTMINYQQKVTALLRANLAHYFLWCNLVHVFWKTICEVIARICCSQLLKTGQGTKVFTWVYLAKIPASLREGIR
jgi:hypothetical protein